MDESIPLKTSTIQAPQGVAPRFLFVNRISSLKQISNNTYNIVGDSELKNPLISDMDRVRIDNGINTTLQSKGKVQITESKADVLISYFIVTKDKVKINST